MRRRTAGLAAALVLALSACAPTADDPQASPASGLGAGRVADVDTPALRRIKATTQIPPCEPGPGEPVGGGLPDLDLPCLGGGEDVNLGSLRGPMVVNLWAQWCTPCKTELPVYEEFHQRYGDRVAVVGVDFNDQLPEDALRLAKASGTSYPQLADPAARLIGPVVAPSSGLPVHLFIDADGRLVAKVSQAIRSLDDLEDLARTHLGVEL